MSTESFEMESVMPGAPLLEGIHHLKLPVSDLEMPGRHEAEPMPVTG